MKDPLYYIQAPVIATETARWLRIRGNGYTADLLDAGQFSQNEAAEMIRKLPGNRAFLKEHVDMLAESRVEFSRLSNVQPLALNDLEESAMP